MTLEQVGVSLRNGHAVFDARENAMASRPLNFFTMLCVASLTSVLQAQLLTIPEALAKAGRSLSSGPSVPSGPAPSIDHVLAETDFIVRGVPGEPATRLSDDEMEVFTEYPLRNAAIRYNAISNGVPAERSSPLVVTVFGGTIVINGLSYTSAHGALGLLQPSAEYLLLLKMVGRRYFLAGQYYGAFQITGSTATNHVRKPGFAEELNGKPVTEVEQTLLARIKAAHPVR
jgi:hypothetical protein